MRTHPRTAVMPLIAFLLCVILSSHAQALLIEKPLDELVAESDSIIRGFVTETRSEWNPERTLIHTYVTVEVKEAIKGLPGRRSETIKLPGGEVGDIGLRVEDVPGFSVGEEVILFLRAEHPRLTGLSQGKYTVIRDESDPAKSFVVSACEHAYDRQEGGVQEFAQERAPLDVFLDNLKELVRAQSGSGG
ncbi:MAG: hypothetical protein HY801_14110 [Candidatus Lindowbacteria bacterium]|nr:hypothetical protein [Candidatus Lindowbacteria bacterium]